MVVQRKAQKYGLDLRSLETNPLFNFWTYYTFDYLIPDDAYGEAILYYDSIPYMDVIANTRLDYELMAPVFLNQKAICLFSIMGMMMRIQMFMNYLIILKRVKMYLIF